MSDIKFSRDPSPITTFTKDPAPVATPEQGGAFFGAAKLLPQSVQKFLPEFMTGPSVGQQLTSVRERTEAEQKRLGRPLSIRERSAIEPVTASPVAMGFATHQLGGDVPVPKIGSAGRAEFARAVKPSVASIRAAGGREPYYAKAEDGIQSIVENRPNLRFVDPDGNLVSGETPKSLDQFDDAVNQTKQAIFQKYDAMAKQAGVSGAQVDLRPIVPELNTISTDHVMMDLYPDVAKYAADKANVLQARGAYGAGDAQRAIQSLNSTLKAFYSNPSYDTYGRASVDAMIANQLRPLLDDAIENSVAPGYQDLKNQYGSLKAIERDVRNRAGVVARQEKGGGIFGRLADVASADEVLRGIFTAHPGAIATGGALQAFKQYVKWRRDPNTAVTSLFRRATTPKVPPSPASPFAAVTSPGASDDTRDAAGRISNYLGISSAIPVPGQDVPR